METRLFTLILLTLVSFPLYAQNKPDLGTLNSFTVLASTALLDNDNSDILGDVGVFPETRIKGFSPLKIKGRLEIGSAKAQQAQEALLLACNFLSKQSPTKNLSNKPLQGQTLLPGVYQFDGDALLDGELILNSGDNPDDIFVFQIEKNLVLTPGATISFSESAKPRVQHIFWLVKGQAILGAGSIFQGAILAQKDITAEAGTLVHGRLLTTGGQVQISDTQISFPTDLALTMTKSSGSGQADIYNIDDYITFTLKAENLGPVSGSTVWVRASLPAGITYVSSQASTAAFDPATATWTLADLPSGRSETLEITCKINKQATEFLTYSASIAGFGMEEILHNNGSTVTGICVAPANPGNIQGPDALCSGSSDNLFRVDPAPGVMSYDWKVPAGWAIVSGRNSPSIIVRAGNNPGIISLTVGNVCLSLTTQKSVSVSAAKPETPGAISTTAARPCSGQGGIVYSIPAVAGATTYAWEVPAGWAITAGQGTPAVTVTAGSSAGNITVKAGNGCGTSAPLPLPVTATPATLPAPAPITLEGGLCTGNTVTLEVKETSGATSYQWSLPAGWQLLSGGGTARIHVQVGAGAGEIKVAATNPCFTSDSTSLPVQVQGLLAGGAISGPAAPCQGLSVVYRLAPVAGAMTYTWQVPAGWQILSGQGSPELQVTAGSTAGHLQVQVSNACGEGPASKLALSPGTLPEKPYTITASRELPCQGVKEIVYAIAAVPGATTYSWTVPAPWVILAGQGTAALTVRAGQAGGLIQVKAGNACGESLPASLQVLPAAALPQHPGPIQSSSPVICQNQAGLQFQVAPQPGTVSFTWQLPADWTLVSGAGTPLITVVAGKMSGKVSVKAYSPCGESSASELAVEPLSASYLSLGAITGTAEVCAGQSGLSYAVPPLAGAASYTWTLPAGWVLTEGQGTNRILVQAGQQTGTISVIAANSCAQSPAVHFSLAQVFPAPPPAIKDLSSACQGLVYAIDQGADLVLPGSPATKPSFTWKVPAGWTIQQGQGSDRIWVQAPAGSGKGLISVIANNGNCVSGPITLVADPAVAEAQVHIANAITANGDGHNDTWEIKNLEKYAENEVIIFNRWGNEVYRSKGYTNNWNGGELLAGTYFYQLKVRVCDGTIKNHQGYVMLLR